MRANLFTVQTLLVLVFGLISCSPDNSAPDTTDNNPALAPYISNSDGTFSRLDKLEGTSVRNTIQLELAPESTKDMLATSHAICKANFLTHQVEFTSHFTNTNKIPVVETLPIEVFTPNKGQERTVVCQHSIKIYLKDSFVGEITFKDITLKDTGTFSNFDLPFLKQRVDKYFLWHDLKTEKLKLHTNNMEIKTLCDRGQKYTFPNKDEVTVTDLVDDSMFENTNTQHCRLALTDRDANRVWLSSSFYMQNYEPTLQVIDFSTDFPGEAFNDLKGKTLAELTIRNRSQVKAYVGFTELDTPVSVLPIYSIPQSKDYRHAPLYSIGARWTLKSPMVVANQYIENKQAYEIPANGTLTFQLKARTAYSSCGFAFGMRPFVESHSIACENQLTYSGSFYRVEHMPSVDLDLTTDFNFRRVRRFVADPLPQTPQGHLLPHWAPVKNVAKICSDRTSLINQFEAPITSQQTEHYNGICDVR